MISQIFEILKKKFKKTTYRSLRKKKVDLIEHIQNTQCKTLGLYVPHSPFRVTYTWPTNVKIQKDCNIGLDYLHTHFKI